MQMKSFIVFASALLLATAIPATAAEPRDPVPAGNPGEWAAPGDYPSAALRGEIEGVVGFRLTVDAKGIPSDCTLTRSSGDATLDETTCRLMRQRARFSPASDRRGRAVPGTWSSSVRWEIPNGPRPWPKPSDFDASFVVEADGSVSECRVERREGLPAALDACTRIKASKFQQPLDSFGRPTRLRVHTKNVTTVEYLPI